MSYYRVVFRKNELLSCILTAQGTNVYDSDLVYVSEESKLSFALVKAANDKEAVRLAQKMIDRDKQD